MTNLIENGYKWFTEALDFFEIDNYTRDGVMSNIEYWAENKANLIKMFRNHPNWDEELLSIVIDSSYNRTADYDTTQNLVNDVEYVIEDMGYTIPYNTKRILDRLNEEICQFVTEENNHIFREYGIAVTVGMKTSRIINKLLNEQNLDVKNLLKVGDKIYFNPMKANTRIGGVYVYDGMESMDKTIPYTIRAMGCDGKFYVEESGYTYSVHMVKEYDQMVAEYRAKNRLIDNEDYRKQSAKLFDALNPLKVENKVVISLNPFAYLAMSYGNSWCSCHCINGDSIRFKGDTYHGQYKAGCLSYMNDNKTICLYVVKGDTEGSAVMTNERLHRELFMYENGVLLQSRLYPNKTDEAMKTDLRNLVEGVIAHCESIPNLWKMVSEAYNRVSTHSYALQYEDYMYSDSDYAPKMAYNELANPNNIRVDKIGYYPYCLVCGDIITNSEILICDYCNGHICANCGCHIDADDNNSHCINGEWYCEGCHFYCEYHNEYESGEPIYAYDYCGCGCHVCADAPIFVCEDCNYTYFDCADYIVERLADNGRVRYEYSVCEDCVDDYIRCEYCNTYHDEEDYVEILDANGCVQCEVCLCEANDDYWYYAADDIFFETEEDMIEYANNQKEAE